MSLIGVRRVLLFSSNVPAFVFEVDTTATSSGSSNADQFKLPTDFFGSYNCLVDWGDGTSDGITTYNDAAWTHTYASSGTYTISITGVIENIRFNNGGDKLKIGEVSQWGPLLLTDVSGGGHFYGCTNLTSSASDYPKIASGYTNFSSMFRGCSSFNADLSSWDVSSGTNFSHMFQDAASFTADLSSWDVSSGTNFFFMFRASSSFNADLSSWDVSSGTNFSFMFSNASSFDQNLGSWDVSNGTDVSFMFSGATLSTANYDALLIGWEALDLVDSRSFHGGNSTYSAGAAATARAAIIADDLWTITDGGPA